MHYLRHSQAVQACRLSWPLLILLPVLLMSTGLSPQQAVEVTLVITVQALGGVVLLLSWRKGQLGTFGQLGIGLALGTSLSVASSMIFRTLIPHGLTWAIPTAVLVLFSLFRRKPDTGQRHELKELALAVLVVLAGLAQFIPFLRRNPLDLTNWTSLYGDIAYHEALSHSLVAQGPLNLTALGQPIRYHWLADAWTGFMTEVCQLGSFVALTRALPVYVLVAVVLIAWELGRRLGGTRAASILAGFVLVMASGVGLAAASTYGLVMAEWSPTHMIAMPLVLSLSVIVIGYVSQAQRDYFALVLAGILAAALVVARAPQAMVAGLACAAVAVLWRHRSTMRNRSLELLVAVILGMAITYFVVVSGGPPNGLSLKINNEIATGLGLVSFGSELGGWLAVPALIAALLAGWSGAFVLLASKGTARRTAGVWGLASGVTGIVFCMVLSQPGGSEITFLWAASVVIFPLSGVGTSLAWTALATCEPSLRRVALAMIAAGVLIGATSVLIHEWSLSQALGGYLRWGMPLGLLAVAAILGLARTRRDRTDQEVDRHNLGLARAVLLLVPAALSASLVGLVWNSTSSIPHATAATPLAITKGHLEAGAWIQAHTPREAIFATDRQCGDPADTPPACGSMWSGPAALGARQSLVEGHSYSLGEGALSPTNAEKVFRSWNFGRNPNQADACYLVSQGVGWFWADHGTASAAADMWKDFGHLEFENDVASIFRLKISRCGAP